MVMERVYFKEGMSFINVCLAAVNINVYFWHFGVSPNIDRKYIRTVIFMNMHILPVILLHFNVLKRDVQSLKHINKYMCLTSKINLAKTYYKEKLF